MPGDHQDLLEDLRRLRQRVELARVHAARHEVVARALGRGLREDGRLDLEEALLVEVAAHGEQHPVAQQQVLLHARPPQVEVAVAQPRLVGRGGVLGDLEGRRLRLGEHAQLAQHDLDLAGGHLRVHRVGRAALDAPEGRDDELGPHALGRLDERLVVAGRELGQAVAVAQVDEDERPEVADAVRPAEQHHVGADFGRGERPAGVRASERAQSFNHGSSSARRARPPRPRPDRKGPAAPSPGS